jgi:anaerobic selenocysteine-containing dehydrogenase
MREVRHSVCALDCPDACSVLVTVEDGRAVQLRGNPDHPITRGFLCAKVARYLDREYHPERLLFPMKRTGEKGEGKFARISWDEALDTVAARLKIIAAEYGPESVLPYSYGGTLGYLQGSGMDRRFFHRLGASRLDRTICSAAGGEALTSTFGPGRVGLPPEQFRKAKLILAWGANVMGTNVHLWPFILEARRQGAKFYTIDPRKNKTGNLADRHFFIHPGSDAALAFGMIHVIFAENLHDADYIEQFTTNIGKLRARVAPYTPQRTAELTGIGAEEVVALAREYAVTKPAAIRLNYGVQRSERGALSVEAVSMLSVITGSWKHDGGGMQLSTSGAFQINRPALERPDLQQKALGREARIINMSKLGEALTLENDPPVKAVVVYNSNPAAVAPNQNSVHAGLRRADLFTVVLEQFQTDTADFADILLPATTFLEHTDAYFAYGHYYIQMARPAVDAPGEAKSNVEIFRGLAGRMGFDDSCFGESEEEMIRGLLNSNASAMRPATFERLSNEHSVRLNVPEQPYAEGGFTTPSGKVNLDLPDYVPPVESRFGDAELRSRYPIELISSKNDDSMNSTFGNRPDTDRQTERLELNAQDASRRGISDGDAVRVFNDRGDCLMVASVNGRVAPGVACAPAVRQPKRAHGGRGVNALVSERLTDKGGGPVFYSCLVEVERVGD